MGYQKGGVLLKGALSRAYILPGKNFGRGSNSQIPFLAMSMIVPLLSALSISVIHRLIRPM